MSTGIAAIPLLRTLSRKQVLVQMLAKIASWAEAIRFVGTRSKRTREATLFVRTLNRRVTLRWDTSDLRCLEKVLIDQEYRLPFKLNPRVIIDAGANIGLATLYFAHVFSQSRIIAIEPEPSNYELLVRNCQGIPNIIFRQAALWNTSVSLQIANPEAENWAFAVTPAAEGKTGGIRATTIPELLREIGEESVDILKLDIEGAERELFSDGCEEWLPRVKLIIIELHDRYKAGCSRAVYSKLCQFPFRQEIRGENVFILLSPSHETEQTPHAFGS